MSYAEARSPRSSRNLDGGSVRAGDRGAEPEDAIALLDLLLHRLPGQRGTPAAGGGCGGGDAGAAQGNNEDKADAGGADSSEVTGGAGGGGFTQPGVFVSGAEWRGADYAAGL